MRRGGGLADAQLLGQQHDADAVGLQVAVALRREVRGGPTQPFQHLQAALAGQGAGNLLDGHIAISLFMVPVVKRIQPGRRGEDGRERRRRTGGGEAGAGAGA